MLAANKTIFNLSELPSEILLDIYPHILIYYFM